MVYKKSISKEFHNGLIFRAIASFIGLIVISVYWALGIVEMPFAPIAIVCCVEIFLDVVYYLIFRSIIKVIPLFYFGLIIDVIAMSIIIHYLGGAGSSIIILGYPLIIIYAGIVLPEFGCYVITTCCSLAYLLLFVLEFYKIIPSGGLINIELPGIYAVPRLVGSILFFYIIAYATKYFAMKLDRSKKELFIIKEKLEEYNKNLENVVKERTKSLVESKKQLEEYSRTLEEKVEQRTSQLLQSEKMAAIGTLASGIVHEVNNPISIILGQAKIIERNGVKSSVVKEGIKIILDESMRIGEMVKRLLTFAHAQHGKREPLYLPNMLRSLVESLAPIMGKHISVKCNFSSDFPMLEAEKGRIQQIFSNLIINASHAMPKGGTISIEGNITNNLAIISIADTGAGIPRKLLDRVFEPFFTTKAEGAGTGLGLTIVKESVEELGGAIRVDSEVSKGTRFTIRLPVVKS